MMSAFRRTVQTETSNKGKGFSKGSFWDKFRIPQNNPTPWVWIRADYVDHYPSDEEKSIAQGQPVMKPFFKFEEHKRKAIINGKEQYPDEPCSAGHNPHAPQPCVGCYAMDTGDKTTSKSTQFAFGLVHLHPYHGHPIIQENGQALMKQDGSGYVLGYDECLGRLCNFCRVLRNEQPIVPPNAKKWELWPGYRPQDITTIFGRRRYVKMGKGHLGDLEGWDQIISASCGTCKSQLITDSFNCPSCNNIVIDMQSDTRTDEELAQVVIKPYPCLTCQKTVYLKEIVTCDVCEAAGRPTVHNSMFDVVVWGMRQGEKKQSKLVQGRPAQTIEEFEAQLPPQIRQMIGNKTLRQHIEEIGQPYDFDDVFKPRDLAAQAKRLSLNMPGGQQAPQQQPYGGYAQPQAGYGQPAPQQGFYAPQGQPYGGYQQPPAQGGYPAAPQQQQQYQQPPPPQQPYAAPQAQPYAAPQAQPYAPPQGQPQPGPQPFVPPGRQNYGNS